MKISKDTIVDCIKSGCTSLEEVVECTKAGSCCTACHKKIKLAILEEMDSK
jgi:NAD(P)H-nitrite reductase large subunit